METLLLLRKLKSVIGFRKSKIYQLIESGQFTQPIKIGRSGRWRSSKVQNWIQNLTEDTPNIEADNV